MTNKELLIKLFDWSFYPRPDLEKIGEKMFKFETQHGLPSEIFMDELLKKRKLTNDEKGRVLEKFLTLSLEHKLKSGLIEKNIGKTKERNRKLLMNILDGKDYN